MAHIHEEIDFTVTPLAIHPDKDKVLLVNHPRYQKWLSIGGHIELDESPDEALLREVKEECGLDVEILEEHPGINGVGYSSLYRPRYMDIHSANDPHRHIGMVYFCLAKSGDFVLSDEHDEMAWFTIEQLEGIKNNLSELMYFYCIKALEEVSK